VTPGLRGGSLQRLAHRSVSRVSPRHRSGAGMPGGQVCGSSGLQGRTRLSARSRIPSPRGHCAWLSPHTLRRGCALARRTVSRRPLLPSGAFHGGTSPGRFRGVWLHRSPPRPSTPHLSVARGGPRGPYDRDAPHANACARDPPDLDADFPVASRSMRSSLSAELPLLGLSKDRPSIVSRR
jgi:hypothetical protein